MGRSEGLKSRAEEYLQSKQWQQARSAFSDALKAELDDEGGLQKRMEFVAELYHGRAIAKTAMGEALPDTEKVEPPKYECPKEDMLEDAMVDCECAYNMDKSKGVYVYQKGRVFMVMKRFREAEKAMKKAQSMGSDEATDAIIKECEERFPEEDEHYKLPDGVELKKVDVPIEHQNKRLVQGIVQEVGEDCKDYRIGDRVMAWVDREQLYQQDD